MSKTEIVSNGMNRRGFMRKSVAGATAVGAVSYGSLRIDNGPVQSVEANPLLAPLIVAGGAVAVGWMISETYDILGSDEPVFDGNSGEFVEERIYATGRTRKSTNSSTFIDNKNIIEGLPNMAYTDGKIEAIKVLNNGGNVQEALTASTNEVDKVESRVLKNFLNGWNESVLEYQNLWHFSEDALEEDIPNYTRNIGVGGSQRTLITDYENTGDVDISPIREYELPNGEVMEMEVIICDTGVNFAYTPISYERNGSHNNDYVRVGINDTTVTYLRFPHWNDIYNLIKDKFTETRDGLNNYIVNAEEQIEEGNLQPEDMLSSRELSELYSTNEDYPRALADLQQLNVPVDGERTATIELVNPEEGEDNLVRAEGYIAYTGEGQLSVGVIEPNEDDEDYYFITDISESGEPTNYQTIPLKDEFEIITFTDSEGDVFEETDFQRFEAHRDDNYITTEEWEEIRENQERIIENSAEEEEESNGGGGIIDTSDNFLFERFFGIPVWGYLSGGTLAAYLFGGSD